MIEFRVSPHTQPGMPAVVEVWTDGRFVATIYGSHPKSGPVVRVLSKHALAVEHDSGLVSEARITIIERP